MIFENHISDIARAATYIEMGIGPTERLQLDMIDLRRLDLRTAAAKLREAARRCDSLAERFDEPVPVKRRQLQLAE